MQAHSNVHIFSTTIDMDPLWKRVVTYIRDELQQPENADEVGSLPIAYSTFNEQAIRAIMAKSKESMDKQKREGRKRIRGTLIVFDDLSHDPSMQKHASGVMAEIICTSRHSAVSIIASTHSVNSLGTPP